GPVGVLGEVLERGLRRLALAVGVIDEQRGQIGERRRDPRGGRLRGEDHRVLVSTNSSRSRTSTPGGALRASMCLQVPQLVTTVPPPAAATSDRRFLAM